jgi:hypothetical protein
MNSHDRMVRLGIDPNACLKERAAEFDRIHRESTAAIEAARQARKSRTTREILSLKPPTQLADLGFGQNAAEDLDALAAELFRKRGEINELLVWIDGVRERRRIATLPTLGDWVRGLFAEIERSSQNARKPDSRHFGSTRARER